MKTWVLIAVAWIALVIGGEYYLTGMNNDQQDNLAGRVAGFGAGALAVVGFLRRNA